MWGLIPLLVLVFTGGGGWSLLSSMESRLSDVEAVSTQHLQALGHPALDGRVTAVEQKQREQDRRLRSIEGNVIAICIATGAQCAQPQ